MKRNKIKKFDLIVIGGGSGGVRAARIASLHGAKVAICEKDKMGGTCVIRGCIPKKLLFYSSQFQNIFSYSDSYGWSTRGIKYDFLKMIKNKNKEITRLEKIYEKNIIASGATILKGEASFINKNKIKINNDIISGDKIIIASGGTPISLKILGSHFADDSDTIMQLSKLPKTLTIVGAGYIAIEFAFIFANLGSEVSLIVRKNILRGFDDHLVEEIKKNLIRKKVKIYFNNEVEEIKKYKNKFDVFLKNKTIKSERVLVAIGRKPNIKSLNLNEAGINLNSIGAIKVNKKLQTNISNIYAIGDVTDRFNLTPVAIAEGHALADKLFSSKNKEVDLSHIGTAVFSSPPICSIGLTELEAFKKFTKVDVYESNFNSLKYSIVKKKVSTYIKLLVNSKNNRIIGAHMLGEEAPEIVQIIGVAINAKATFRNFMNTMAIHPTVAEEFVTFKDPTRKNY